MIIQNQRDDKLTNLYKHTVSWSNIKLAESPKSGKDEILSTTEETNDGSSPKHCLVLTFLVCTNEKGETNKLHESENRRTNKENN